MEIGKSCAFIQAQRRNLLDKLLSLNIGHAMDTGDTVTVNQISAYIQVEMAH